MMTLFAEKLVHGFVNENRRLFGFFIYLIWFYNSDNDAIRLLLINYFEYETPRRRWETRAT